jgi:hypothetical protein
VVRPDEVDEVDDVELEVEVNAVRACEKGDVPGIVRALTTLRVPTAATEPKATPAVRRFSSRNARSLERTFCCSAVPASMFEESGGRS